MKKDKNVKESDPRKDNALQDKVPGNESAAPAAKGNKNKNKEIASDDETEIALKINQAETERD